MTVPIPQLVTEGQKAGYWRVWWYPVADGGHVKDVTFFRGAPTDVASVATQDPFGPTTAQIRFPAVTYLDDLGSGDMSWMIPETDVDLCWMDPDTDEPVYRWEGFAEAFENGANGLTVTLRGAGYQADYWLAKPEYVYQPIPYEQAIARQFANRPDSRMGPMLVSWPSWWTTRFALSDYANKDLYLRPTGLEDGQLWSGLVTRSTGSFDKALTGYTQGLLSSMYTEYGQFTVMMEQGRRPVLFHRDRLAAPTASTWVLDMLTPGLDYKLSRDYSQRLNVVYGQGKALNGATYSGMRVSADGTRIWYEPFAARNAVHPQEGNLWFDPTVMRREVNLSFYEGLSEADALSISKGHLQRFSDPGVTGTIAFATDPAQDGVHRSRYLVKAGDSILLNGLYGRPGGVLFHITECEHSSQGTSVTVDTKFRDQLTVQEVSMRTRDALAPIRLLTAGSYKPNIPDLLFPWSYADGSGFIPKPSRNLFDGSPNNLAFPWEDWTRQRPPRDPQWRDSYIRIGPASDNADNNWANMQQSLTDFKPYPVRMSQAGESVLLQIAAFDKNGSIMRVPYHVSIFRTNGVSYSSMPMMGMDDEAANVPYLSGQHYPFFERAWEEFATDGTALSPETGRVVQTAEIIAGWGNFYELAGFWPSTSLVGGDATGLLVDEKPFSWDLTDAVYGVDPQRPADENLKDPNRADLQVMIYCDAQVSEEVFFLGRIFRKEPGMA